MPTKRAKEIALAFPRGSHQEVFITGVLRFSLEFNCNWSYITSPESLAMSVLDLRGWRGDGIIAALNTPSEAACVKHLNAPVVNISGTLAKTPVPRVSLDNGMVGRLAAEHLMERGFETFAYFGLRDVAYSVVRQNAFDARLQDAGGRSVALLMPPTYRAKGLAVARPAAEACEMARLSCQSRWGYLPLPIIGRAKCSMPAGKLACECRRKLR